jgi:hypothetical protein
MRKTLITITVLFSVLCFACSKQENKEPNTEAAESSISNSAQIISGDPGTKKAIYRVSLLVGHKSSGCSGCVTSGGSHIHVDCQGSGNACKLGASMNISSAAKSTDYYGIVADPDELTSGDSFLMPARSLYIIGSNGEFLNIPEQEVYRDEETGAFIFHDIFFSDWQMFGNE